MAALRPKNNMNPATSSPSNSHQNGSFNTPPPISTKTVKGVLKNPHQPEASCSTGILKSASPGTQSSPGFFTSGSTNHGNSSELSIKTGNPPSPGLSACPTSPGIEISKPSSPKTSQNNLSLPPKSPTYTSSQSVNIMPSSTRSSITSRASPVPDQSTPIVPPSNRRHTVWYSGRRSVSLFLLLSK